MGMMMTIEPSEEFVGIEVYEEGTWLLFAACLTNYRKALDEAPEVLKRSPYAGCDYRVVRLTEGEFLNHIEHEKDDPLFLCDICQKPMTYSVENSHYFCRFCGYTCDA